MLSQLKYYVLNTSFHGFRYLVEENCHWSERIFWFICCGLSWIASGFLIEASWNDFQHNAISFVVETSYLDWDTNFPSISICETDNQDRIAEVTDKLYGDPHDYNLDEIIKELVYFRGLSFYTLQLCGSTAPPNENCIYNNFSAFSSLVRSKCQRMLRKCKWNDVEFDCCQYFLTLDTELGECFALNSMQTRIKNPLAMISNRHSGPGTLYLEIDGNVNVYILGEQEVPSLTALQTDVLQVTPHVQYHRFMSINEIENQPEVRDVSIEQRNCRFMDESYLDVHDYYSYSACCVQCRKDAQIGACGCTHHLMPNTGADAQCNITGLECLNKNYNDLAVLKAHWSNRSGLICECVPSCTEIEMAVVKDTKAGIPEDYSVVELTLERLPTERFQRNVVKGKLDLVVSMGGATALFLGASILSFVEIIYYFTLRPISNVLLRRERESSASKKIALY